MSKMKSGNNNQSEISQKNFIYNEDNIIRLVYVIAIQLKMPYKECLEFIKIDKITDRVDFLINYMDKSKFIGHFPHSLNCVPDLPSLDIGTISLDNDITFDVSNPEDLARIEYTVEKMNIPQVVKRTMKNEIKRLKQST